MQIGNFLDFFSVFHKNGFLILIFFKQLSIRFWKKMLMFFSIVEKRKRRRNGKTKFRLFLCWNPLFFPNHCPRLKNGAIQGVRSEEHTSELQSRPHLVCRLLLEK